MAAMLAFGYFLSAVAISSAIKLPAHLLSINRAAASQVAMTERRRNGELWQTYVDRTARDAKAFVHDEMKYNSSKRALIVQVISADQIGRVQANINAVGRRADWLLCAPDGLDDESKQTLIGFSSDAHEKYDTSIKLLRPQGGAELVSQIDFIAHAIKLDTSFVEEHDNLWLVDKNINFAGFDYDAYMTRQQGASMHTPALISQPIIKQKSYFLNWNTDDSWLPHPDVLVAYSTIVDSQAAMIDTKFFIWLMESVGQVGDAQAQKVDSPLKEMWCGGAAKYLTDVMGKSLKPGESPCAIITIPIDIDHGNVAVKDENSWSPSSPDAETSGAESMLFERQRTLVAEMELFTAWPNQRCEACSTSQCSDGIDDGKCCQVSMEFNASSTCTLGDNSDLLKTKQVVSPASRAVGVDYDNLQLARQSPRLLEGPPTLRSAFDQVNGAVFIIGMPERQERMLQMAQFHLNIPLERIVLVPGVPKRSTLNNSILVERGIISVDYWKQSLKDNVKWYKEGRELSSGRVACYLAHMRAHRMFVDSSFDVALFLEDDLDEKGIASDEWQQKAYTLFTSDVSFGQSYDSNRAPAAVYLGYCFEGCPASARTFDLGNVVLRDADKPMCTHAYATNRKASTTFLEATLPMDDPIDWVMPRIFKAARVRSLIVNPPILWQNMEMNPLVGGESKAKDPFCHWYGCNCPAVS
jgi:GR25 family glycosyltransferase involved in LPS biosynthesis